MALDAVRLHGREFLPREDGSDPPTRELLALIRNARFVLLGEASHGTHEFYRERARLTRLLIEQKGFTAVAVEADWPDAYRVNRFIRGHGHDRSPQEALGDFKRFPTWMWRNHDVVELVDWLRDWNSRASSEQERVGFYGIDLYSLHASIDAVLDYLEKVDPEAARKARDRYSCFEFSGNDPQLYGLLAASGSDSSCEDEAVRQLIELRRKAAEYVRRDGLVAMDEYFFAEQNARLVRNAERYYRAMFRGRVHTWNLRDTHMADTLDALAAHLDRTGRPARIVVWAHNSHLGDARATELGQGGELNVGQLMRQRHGDRAVCIIGFSTHDGTVTAADDWGAPAGRKLVRPALIGSWEALYHEAGHGHDLLVPMRRALGGEPIDHAFREDRLERAIGVVYRPETERWSHYFHARVADQFDAVIHFDRTRAVVPLEPGARWEGGEDDAPETYPFGV